MTTFVDHLIDVEPDSFDAASAVMGRQVADQLARTDSTLGGALGGSAQMAGDDPGGVQWAAAYDQAAAVTVGGIADLANACHSIAALLQQTGFNHGSADAASTPGGAASPPDSANYNAAIVTPPSLPSASGGSGSTPDGWSLVKSLVGYAWPDGDPGRLRGAAQAWTAAASSLRAAVASVPDAVVAIQHQTSPEIPDAVAVCQGIGNHILDVATACDDVAHACSDYADHLDETHRQVVEMLEELVAWTVGIEAAGALGALVTFGGAEIPAQIAEGARITATAAEIGGIIARLAEFAGSVGRVFGGVAERVGQIAQRLKAVLGARLSKATVEEAGKLPVLGKDAEVAAEEHLAAAADAGLDVVEYSDKAAARLAFDGDLRAAANRFFRDSTSKSEQFKTGDLPDGGHRKEFFSPANNPAYGKLYVQEIDASGKVVKEYKDTLGPDGLIERKWLTGGP